ncbi:hypothetical protein CAPTEDRAFT_202428 [Capitella teleta]|uniref:Uncharacterized protein n=1 Tax=Capitella teleta TaxID=283909 RepID=R7U6B8_CAPTE|nr:hypothetical protein CAPTEDRAFT_202428 [Capitella teleta]|eukprot:ELT99226.1 hypothetical protein CAPTEDRAFT_202428 [Capitella teleta]
MWDECDRVKSTYGSDMGGVQIPIILRCDYFHRIMLTHCDPCHSRVIADFLEEENELTQFLWLAASNITQWQRANSRNPGRPASFQTGIFDLVSLLDLLLPMPASFQNKIIAQLVFAKKVGPAGIAPRGLRRSAAMITLHITS